MTVPGNRSSVRVIEPLSVVLPPVTREGSACHYVLTPRTQLGVLTGSSLTRAWVNSLQCAPWGLMAALAQLVGDMRVDTDSVCPEPQGDVGDSRSSSGFYELGEGLGLLGVSDPPAYEELSPGCVGEPRAAYAGERPKSVGEIFMAKHEGLLEPSPRAKVPRSFSAPYPSLEGIAEGTGEEEPCSWGSGYPSPRPEEGPTVEDFQEALRVESYILGLIQRRILPLRPGKPRTTLGPDSSRGVARQSSLCRKEAPFVPERRDPPLNLPAPEGPQAWVYHSLEEERAGGAAEDCLPLRYSLPRPAGPASLDPSSSEPDSPQRIPDSPRSPSPSDRDRDQLVSAHYIPAQPCRGAPHLRGPTHRPSAPAKPPQRTPYSPERGAVRPRGAAPRKCRGSGEESPAPRKAGRRAGRSQSENSLLGQRSNTERKYNTVERDGGRGQPRPRRPQPGSLGYRRWRSTQELSQDEGEPPGGDQQASRRPRKPRPPPPPYPYSYAQQGPVHAYRHGNCPEQPAPCRPEDVYAMPVPGESESSLSEADSPGSSSLSTDSDESGGLVWPQQLPPQLATPPTAPGGHAQPKAFVKIKASHALKKKILRFRTGSLKVMTTV
ncbi:hypothetical protein JZ751_002020 [Albula glossodonta]|uniref:Dapper homolog 3 n=1 Tax=Albula glossodonta TaxID=121402 RepID=A0A8T2P6U5_9TELE|nr:hypothetical protein JZ751_002020 [Albula glossodonta]